MWVSGLADDGWIGWWEWMRVELHSLQTQPVARPGPTRYSNHFTIAKRLNDTTDSYFMNALQTTKDIATEKVINHITISIATMETKRPNSITSIPASRKYHVSFGRKTTRAPQPPGHRHRVAVLPNFGWWAAKWQRHRLIGEQWHQMPHYPPVLCWLLPTVPKGPPLKHRRCLCGVDVVDDVTKLRMSLAWSASGRRMFRLPWGVGLNSAAYGSRIWLGSESYFQRFAGKSADCGTGSVSMLLLMPMILANYNACACFGKRLLRSYL